MFRFSLCLRHMQMNQVLRSAIISVWVYCVKIFADHICSLLSLVVNMSRLLFCTIIDLNFYFLFLNIVLKKQLAVFTICSVLHCLLNFRLMENGLSNCFIEWHLLGYFRLKWLNLFLCIGLLMVYFLPFEDRPFKLPIRDVCADG